MIGGSRVVNKRKWVLNIGITLWSVLGFQPQSLYAASGYGGGDGTSENPYLIATPAQLNQLQIDVNQKQIDTSGKVYKLTQNIDLSGFDNDENEVNGNWKPIGSDGNSFKGVFLGEGYTISNVVIDQESSHSGLFGLISGGEIQDLNLKSFKISGTELVGVLAGEVESGSVLTNIHTEGEVVGTIRRIGGMIGYIKESSITNSGSKGVVIGNETVGGLAGRSYLNGITQNLYSSAEVEGVTEVGGVFGKHSSSTLRNIRSSGSVKGTKDVGGLIGYMSDAVLKEAISKATVDCEVGGRLIGYKKGEGASVYDSYVDGSKNPGMMNVFRDDLPGKTRITELMPEEMSGESAKENMPGIAFDEGWVLSPDGEWVLKEELLMNNQNGQAQVQVEGVISPLLGTITVPSEALTFHLNPNQPEGSQFVAPNFEIINAGQAPIRVEIKTFEQKTSILNDVLPNKYADWNGLNKEESKDIALALEPQPSEGWVQLIEGSRYVADNFNHHLGVIRANSSVSFGFQARHGSAFEQGLKPEYLLSFVFDLS